MEGTAVLSTPTTVESLMKSFTGKHYVNATGDIPSLRQRQDNLQGADVLLQPGNDLKPDSWQIEEDGHQRWLVRHHNVPRLTLFTPARVQAGPVAEDQLTGKRITKLTPMTQGAAEVVIDDDYLDEPCAC